MFDAETQDFLITELAAVDAQTATEALADPVAREKLFLDLAIEAVHNAREYVKDSERWLKLSYLYEALANDPDVGLPGVYL